MARAGARAGERRRQRPPAGAPRPAGGPAGSHSRAPRAAAEAAASRSRWPFWIWLAPLVVAVLSVPGYFLVVPLTVAAPSRLAHLVVAQPRILALGAKPYSSQAQDAAASGVSTLAADALAQPTRTASWQVSWVGAGKRASSVGVRITVDQLPGATGAAAVEQELRAIDLAPVLGTYQRTASIAVPKTTIEAATYRQAPSVHAAASFESLATMRAGDGVAMLQVNSATPALKQVLALARRELSVLSGGERGFRLATVVYPAIASLVWWLAALACAAAGVGAPRLVVAASRRRAARREAIARQQFQMRGQKVLKRRAPPGRRAAAPARRRTGR